MAFFETKIVRARVTVSLFTAEQMQDIAGAGLMHIKRRIQSVQDADDTRARPLKVSYAEEKRKGRYVSFGGGRKYRGLPVRDWTLRGRTMQSLRVKRASAEMATIGPISTEAYKIMAARNKLDNMWGWSPSDLEAVYAKVYDILANEIIVRVTPETGAVAA